MDPLNEKIKEQLRELGVDPDGEDKKVDRWDISDALHQALAPFWGVATNKELTCALALFTGNVLGQVLRQADPTMLYVISDAFSADLAHVTARVLFGNDSGR